ncbi:MAG TPA: IS1595 family transposase [Pyrinomonadaceae bacterium]|jgi:transposase-like protein|nr:IS1595 family transposase [Pyrinomonadaceae bacterium]
MKQEPKTLQEAIVYFSNPDNCREYLIARRWPNGVTCPRCDSPNVTYSPKHNRWQCASHHQNIEDKRRQFTLKTGTIFEDSNVKLDKWLMAMWMVVNCKNGVSSYEIHRAIGVTQKTAWFMDHRIRLALGMEPSEKMVGHIEVDETFIGGRARYMHKADRKRKIHGTGGYGKVAVMGLLDRHSKQVRTMVVPNVRRRSLDPVVRQHVEAGSNIYSDAFKSYTSLQDEYVHQVIDHAEKYVDGQVHTNGIENFWSLLKRTLKGTYVSVEPFHLFRYLDEQSFRFNNRTLTDGQRFDIASRAIIGKRLTFAEVTGKTDFRRPHRLDA